MLCEFYLKTTTTKKTVCLLLDSQPWNQRWRPVARHPHPLLFLGSQQSLTFLTEAAPIAWETKADEGVDLINAGTSVLTGAGDTVVNVWRGEEGAESEVSLPLVPSPHRKPGRRWGHDPAINPGPKCSSSGLTNGSMSLEVKRVEPHMINITALMRADTTGLAGARVCRAFHLASE